MPPKSVAKARTVRISLTRSQQFLEAWDPKDELLADYQSVQQSAAWPSALELELELQERQTRIQVQSHGTWMPVAAYLPRAWLRRALGTAVEVAWGGERRAVGGAFARAQREQARTTWRAGVGVEDKYSSAKVCQTVAT